MEIKYRFPNMFPGTKTVIVLKQPKTEGSIRNAYIPDTVANKLRVLRGMQQKLQEELGEDGYMDYDLIICQANGRPIMTEHLNARFKAIIADMNDPTIPAVDFVFHSIRHTSTGFKLKVSKGDLKSVQGDGGWNTPEMITRRYAEIIDEDRKKLADEMETAFYKNDSFRSDKAQQAMQPTPALDANQIATMLSQNPNLLVQVFQTIQQTKQA
jgi:Phage integrase family.